MKGRLSHDGNTVFHIYQKTVNGCLLFYYARDYIVMYTILSIAAKRYGIQVIGLCQMPDHIHLLIRARDRKTIERFVQYYSSHYAEYFHGQYGTEGALFDSPFGIAEKQGDKKIRTAIAYLYNNPVEKKLSSSAEDYRWNYLAYSASGAPFSTPTNLASCRRAFRRAVAELDYCFRHSKPLSAAAISGMTANLTDEEKNQLIDRIIVRYQFIDYEALGAYYENFQMMLLSFRSNTGNEYDIDEEFVSGSDKIYYRLLNASEKLFGKDSFKKVLSLPEEKRRINVEVLVRLTGASHRQVCKFLHLPQSPAV